MKTLGSSLVNLALASGRLAWGFAAGPLGRCYYCGRKRVRIEFPESVRYWGIELIGGDSREILFCPHCERALLANAREIIAQAERGRS